jgi:hypothetical protein
MSNVILLKTFEPCLNDGLEDKQKGLFKNEFKKFSIFFFVVMQTRQHEETKNKLMK